jgi:hypothetical protein
MGCSPTLSWREGEYSSSIVFDRHVSAVAEPLLVPRFRKEIAFDSRGFIVELDAGRAVSVGTRPRSAAAASAPTIAAQIIIDLENA